MGTIRKGGSPSSGYTKLPNELIRNLKISDGTFRLISWVHSHIDGFHVSFPNIKSSLGYGREKLRAIITEAEQNNYLVRVKIQDEKGRYDWDYHVFAEASECKLFKLEHGIDTSYPEGVNPSVVQPSVVQPSVVQPSVVQPVDGSPVGGCDPPHKKNIKSKDQKLEDQGKKFPPNPQTESGEKGEEKSQPIAVEILESGSALGQICFPDQSKPESLQQTENLPLGQNSPAPLATIETTADRVRRVYQETGILPRIPVELEAWVQIDLGSEIVASYRKSGRVTTIKQGDIQPDFARYVSAQNKGKDIDYGYSYIRSLERDPTKWEALAALVIKWQASNGNDALNITKEISKQNQPDYSWLKDVRL
jgi:hypothetical protein